MSEYTQLPDLSKISPQQGQRYLATGPEFDRVYIHTYTTDKHGNRRGPGLAMSNIPLRALRAVSVKALVELKPNVHSQVLVVDHIDRQNLERVWNWVKSAFSAWYPPKFEAQTLTLVDIINAFDVAKKFEMPLACSKIKQALVARSKQTGFNDLIMAWSRATHSGQDELVRPIAYQLNQLAYSSEDPISISQLNQAYNLGPEETFTKSGIKRLARRLFENQVEDAEYDEYICLTEHLKTRVDADWTILDKRAYRAQRKQEQQGD